MRIVREQMLCIVTPGWTGGDSGFADLAPRLDQLFRDAGVVHFASIVLLPPAPGTQDPPSLLLELAVDEGLRPPDLLAGLAHHPGGVLGEIYGHPPTGAPLTPVGARSERVLARLLEGLSVADGGFVGPRDRSVAQVQQERELYRTVRAQAAAVPAACRAERPPFAAALARWLRTDPRFDWATRPAPRSFWRRGRGPVRIYLFTQFGWFYLKLSLLAVAFLQLVGTLDQPQRGYWPGLGGATAAVLGSWLRLAWALLAVAALVVAYRLVPLILGSLARPWVDWTAAMDRELDRPNDAWSARATHGLGLLCVPTLLAALAAAIAYVYFDITVFSVLPFGLKGPDWLVGDRPRWLVVVLDAYALMFGIVLLLLSVGLRNAESSRAAPGDSLPRGALKRFRRRFHRPYDAATARAQQVHPSIERSEAELVGGTAHMTSLAELRRPYWWSAWWTRASLRVVTAAGYAFFTEGRLGDAPGIQYSHWHLLDGGRRLLFCANFDGTFGGYLDDFINGASSGTTLFWRWSELRRRSAARDGHPEVTQDRRFPPTRMLVYRGVKCELRFKAYARESMLPHLYRFDASGLSVDEKDRATQLRDALCGERTDANDECIMRAIQP
jgi:hypothetical protein